MPFPTAFAFFLGGFGILFAASRSALFYCFARYLSYPAFLLGSAASSDSSSDVTCAISYSSAVGVEGETLSTGLETTSAVWLTSGWSALGLS